jgi:uncharacterized protein (TIGR02600 family)
MTPPIFKSPEDRHSERGVALVLVLFGLVLVTMVTVAFLVAMRTESVAARSYSDAAYVRLLADSGVELVKNQVIMATTQTNTAWASQPGAIRTFDAAGNLANVYRLYSSSALIDTVFTPVTGGNATEVPADWRSRPNEFSDLNTPVVAGTNNFYPILNPGVFGAGIKGVSVSGSWLTAASGTPGTPGYKAPELPMPVQWLYQMKDGTRAAMDATTKKIPGATAANPIVGRVAFWADDETCKININTAGAVRDSEPGKSSFWDIPRGSEPGSPKYEQNLGFYQPAQREYQRYPGHPARVALDSVFPTSGNFTALAPTEVYNLTPRVTSEDATLGSYGGTKRPSSMLPLKTSRMYASLDELQFDPTRADNNAKLTPQRLNQLQFLLTAYNRAPELNLFGKPRVSLWPIATTAAKQTPLDKWFARCSKIGDKTFSVTRSNPNSTSEDLTTSGASIPFLFKYLQDQTKDPIPGYGGSFLTKYGANGRDQLLTLMLDYIRCVNLYDSSVSTGTLGQRDNLAGASVPAPYNANAFTPGNPGARSASSSSAFQTPGVGQAIPLKITPATVPTSSGTFKGLGRMDTTISEAGFWVWALQWDDGTVVRADDVVSVNGTDQVAGTYYANASHVIELAHSPQSPLAPRDPNDPVKYRAKPKTVGTGAPLYAAMFVVSPFNPMQGYVVYNPSYLIEVQSGLSGIKFNGNSVFPRDGGVIWVLGQGAGGVGGGGRGVRDTFRFDYSGGKAPFYDGATPGDSILDLWNKRRDYPFYSVVFPVPEAQAGIPVSGGTVKVAIRSLKAKPSESSEVLQVLTFNFSGTTITKPVGAIGAVSVYIDPVNGDRINDENYASVMSAEPGGQWYTMKNRRRVRSLGNDGDDNQNSSTFFVNGDVLFTVEATGSAADFRWLSLQDTSNDFLKNADYDSTGPGKKFAAGLRDWAFSQLNRSVDCQTSSGEFVPGASSMTYTGTNPATGKPYEFTRPLISSRISEVKNSQGNPGDWDNGIGDTPPGAYAGKPDEGTIRYNTASGWPSYYFGAWANVAYVPEDAFFAPNRQIPSAGVFGSLPSRARESNGGWETLLFCPNPAAGTTASEHRGFSSPPDYLWMDLFTMPIVEPYAISEPFSSAGKLNMNYQIVPFTYITRNTHMQAVLAANRISAISKDDLAKSWGGSFDNRYRISPDATLRQFQAKFDNNQIFKSATEICSMWLYPLWAANRWVNLDDAPGSNANIKSWWYSGASTKSPTGDNLREQPYMALYANLTTQSNTFTVYVKAQTIKKVPGTPVDEMTDRDQVTGEYQGATVIERYFDPNIPTYDETLPVTDFKFRTISNKQFVP